MIDSLKKIYLNSIPAVNNKVADNVKIRSFFNVPKIKRKNKTVIVIADVSGISPR